MVYKKYFVLAGLFFLPSCGRKKCVEPRSIIDFHPQKEFYEEYLIDIPVLFYELNTLKTCNENPECTIFSYNASLSLSRAYTFYSQEMERLGWQEIGLYKDREHLEGAHCCTLLYEKPRHYCVVSLSQVRHVENQLRIKVISGMKKEWKN